MQHILTIDDEEQIRDILGQLLTSKGYRVSGGATAAEAIAIVRRDPPDLIITDLQLEESDGFQLIDELKAVAPGTPVILLTGVLFETEVTQRLGEHRIAAYIEKTAPLERILQEVRRVLPAK